MLKLPGCVAAGDTVDETVTNLEEAARAYPAESGEPPEATQSIVELREIEVSVA